MTIKRAWCAVASTALAAGFLAVAPPASAGTTWNPPQQISSRYGRDLNLSRDGRVAVWIRTNRTSENATGGVRSGWYRSAKKGWVPSRPIPGTVGTYDVQLSRNGNYAFMATPTALLVSERLKTNRWQAPEKVAQVDNFSMGMMSEKGNTVAWLEGTTIKARTRQDDGTWRAPVDIGTVSPSITRWFGGFTLSGNGTTLVWVDSTPALVGSTHNGDGTWSPTGPITQLTTEQADDLGNVQLNYKGTRLIWSYEYGEPDGLFTVTRSGATWSPVDYVTYDMVDIAAMSPSGKVVAFTNWDDVLTATQWLGDRWGKSRKLDTSAEGPALAVTNKALVWTPSDYKGSTVRASLLLKGKFTKATSLGSQAMNPAISFDGKTVAWSQTSGKQLLSRKR